MSCRNLIRNGDFTAGVGHWTGDGVRVPTDGRVQPGCMEIPSGGLASQTFASPGGLLTVQIAVRSAAGGELTRVIRDSAGNGLYEPLPVPATAEWSPAGDLEAGLAAGTFVLELGAVGGAVRVDGVWLGYLAATRAFLARLTHDALGELAAGAGYSPAPQDGHPEGHYSDAIDAALRAVGAVDGAGRADIRCLEPEGLDRLLHELRLSMLRRLHLHWSSRTDYQLGPRSESVSQIARAIAAMVGAAGGAGGGNRAVYSRRLHHPAAEGRVLP